VPICVTLLEALEHCRLDNFLFFSFNAFTRQRLFRWLTLLRILVSFFLPNPNALVAVTKGIKAIKVC